MNYKIEHGRIAALQYITTPTGEKLRAIHMGEENKTVVHPESGGGVNYWNSLPLPVQAAINRQFGIVFALPYASRENFVLNSIPFEVAA